MSTSDASMSDSHNISTRTSKFYFKPFRLKDITQEILEAENEPLKRISLPELDESSADLEVSVDELDDVVNILYSTEITHALLETDKKTANVTNHADMKEICVNGVKYLILNELGKGGSSIVYHCYNINTKEERAIKKVNLDININLTGYINEVNVLTQLRNSDRIIHMYDFECIEPEKTLLIVLEKGETDLSRILKDLTQSSKHLPLHIIVFYWMEMLYAVQEIHNHGIIHSDLKPENFLLVNGRLKLIDFGIATCIQENMTSAIRTCQVGSFHYISPEALINQPSHNTDSPNFGKPKYKLKYKTDVWSLGCIFYQLIYQKTPFQHLTHMWAKLSVIMDPCHKIDYPVLDWVPKKIVQSIKDCLQYNIMARPSIIELIKEYENIYFTD